MRVTRLVGESYTMRRGYDVLADQDILVRTYDDGSETVSFRPGRDATDLSWSAEIALEPVSPGPAPSPYRYHYPRQAGDPR